MNVWESQAGVNVVANLSETLDELREYMKTQNEINKALLDEVKSLKEEVISLHVNKADKEQEDFERDDD